MLPAPLTNVAIWAGMRTNPILSTAILALLIAAPSARAGASYASDLARLQQEQQKAVQAALEPVNRRYADALQALFRRATAEGDLDTAVKIKAELQRLGVNVGAVGATAAPLPGTALEDAVFKIDAHSNEGTLVGPGKKGQHLRIQYVDGKWISSKTAMSPDEPSHPMQQVQVFGILGGQEEVIAVVPGGTKHRAFLQLLKKDYEEVRLRANDGERSDNSGEVIYKAAIK